MFTLFGLSVGLFLAVLIMASVRRSKTSKPMKELPDRFRQVESSLAPPDALKFVIRYGQSTGYKIEQLDEDAGRVVFADPERSFGESGPTCFYPIHVSPRAERGSLISVGVSSQYLQIIGLDRPLDSFVAGLRAAVYAQNAGSG